MNSVIHNFHIIEVYLFFLKKAVNVLAVQKLEAHDRYIKSVVINEVIRAISTLFIFFLRKDFTQKKSIKKHKKHA